MDKSFLLIDDDVNVRKLLTLLIRRNNLGAVTAELGSGEDAVDEILFFNPDVVLIDLLLPSVDGVQIVKHAIEKGFTGKFIMISQVEDGEMKSRAYEGGVVFFISKPINTVEVVNIIKGVCRQIDLEKSLDLIRSTLLNVNNPKFEASGPSIDEQITKIFTDTGIIGAVGSCDLRKVIHKIIEMRNRNHSDNYQLQDVYDSIVKDDSIDEDTSVNRKTLEQRIRRTVQKAFETIAELGLEDYGNEVFITYNTMLFDFKQIRQEMRHIKNPNEDPGKINIKKFVEGIISIIKLN